jgi:hypothetical protein
VHEKLVRINLGTRGRVPNLPRSARTSKARPPATRIVLLLLGAGLAGAFMGCGPEPETTAADGVLRGELAVYVADSLDGRSETSYYLRNAAGDEQRLFFNGMPDVAPGARLKVRGTPFADGLAVTSFETMDDGPSELVTSALVGGTPYAKRSFAFVLIDLGGGVNTTADAALGRLMGNSDSIRNYYLYDSYQTQDIDAQVFGPFSYSLPTTCSNTDTRNLATTLRAMIPGTFQHYLWYFGQRTSSCDWGGLGSVGTPQMPAKDTWYNGSTSCIVLVQEPGHNFGMQHSSSLRCPSATLTDDLKGCSLSEYGDVFDPMGNGCRHMNAWQKAYQGWFGGCNGVRVSASATFTLLPFETACNGTQFLQIKAPKARTFMRPEGGGSPASTETFSHYYVELRTPQDFDGTLGNRSAMTPTVLIHAGNDLRTRAQQGLHTYLLDMTPSTSGSSTGYNDAGLAAGQTFTDPAGGLSITAMAVSATSATIQVTYDVDGTAPVCLDGTTFAPPGAADCGSGPVSTGGTGGGAGGAGGTGGTTSARGGAGGTTSARGGAGGIAGTISSGMGGHAGAGAMGRGGVTGAAGDATGEAGRQGAAGSGPNSGVAGASVGGDDPGAATGGISCAAAGGAPAPAGLLVLGVLLALARARSMPRLRQAGRCGGGRRGARLQGVRGRCG